MRFLRIYLSFAPGLLPGANSFKEMESFLDIPRRRWYPQDVKQTFHLAPVPSGVNPFPDTESFLSIPKKGGSFLKNRLEELRKARNISQEELAAALEVSRQTIGSLERGRYNPYILLAFKIARYFDLTIEDIFIYEEDAP